jgi:hypothetical protein
MTDEIGLSPLKLLLIGAMLLPLLAILLLDVRQGGALSNLTNLTSLTRRTETCEGAVTEGVVISRQQLAEFLTISERDARSRVEEVLKAPYCQLPNLSVRAGVVSERKVYPLAFDPRTWLIVLYEGDEYAGYRFLISP